MSGVSRSSGIPESGRCQPGLETVYTDSGQKETKKSGLNKAKCSFQMSSSCWTCPDLDGMCYLGRATTLSRVVTKRLERKNCQLKESLWRSRSTSLPACQPRLPLGWKERAQDDRIPNEPALCNPLPDSLTHSSRVLNTTGQNGLRELWNQSD